MCIEKNLRYLKYLKEKGVSLVKQAYDYELSKENHGTTIRSSILKITSTLGESNAQNTDILENNYWEAKNIINSIFGKEWTQSLNNSSKSDTYSLFQEKPNMEFYLTSLPDRRYIRTLTRSRLSEHKLMVEEWAGRRPIINREERLCPFCNVLEINFLPNCKQYETERKERSNFCPKF